MPENTPPTMAHKSGSDSGGYLVKNSVASMATENRTVPNIDAGVMDAAHHDGTCIPM